jgi:hypothetical protein
MRRLFRLLIAVGLMSSSVGWADALPPPQACPPGTQGWSSHNGMGCNARTCQTDSDCDSRYEEPATCEQWRVCSVTREERVHRRRAPVDSEPVTRSQSYVVGTCDPNDGCTGLEEAPPGGRSWNLDPADVECIEALHCVPESLPDLPRPIIESEASAESKTQQEKESATEGACGCALRSSQAVPLALLGWVGGVALLRRRDS